MLLFIFRKGIHTYSTRDDGTEKIEGEWVNGVLNGEVNSKMNDI